VRFRRADERGEVLQRLLHGNRLDAGLPPTSLDLQHTRLAVEHRLDSSDQTVPAKNRKDVVAVLALGFGDVHLQPVAKVPQRFRAIAVVDQPVER